MKEEINTLIEECAGGDEVNGDLKSLETFRRRLELLQRVVGGQLNGSDDGHMWFEIGSIELGSEIAHEFAEAHTHIFRWNRPHRIHLFLCRHIKSHNFLTELCFDLCFA